MRAYEFLTEQADIKIVLDPMYTTYYDEDDIQRKFKLVYVNAKQFDDLWKKSGQYIGPHGTGQIKDRYQRFGSFVNTANEPIHASTVGIDENGNITFANGRHRFAWFRDTGFDDIPVAMDHKSISHAKTFGILK